MGDSYGKCATQVLLSVNKIGDPVEALESSPVWDSFFDGSLFRDRTGSQSPRLLPALGVLGLGGLLRWAPPVLVVAVSLDGLLQALGKVRMDGTHWRTNVIAHAELMAALLGRQANLVLPYQAVQHL